MLVRMAQKRRGEGRGGGRRAGLSGNELLSSRRAGMVGFDTADFFFFFYPTAHAGLE